MLKVEIDPGSGFCGGVIRAITRAESYLAGEDRLYSLGAIVHNEAELSRLKQKGLVTAASLEEVPRGGTVLIRAHGEPPATYKEASLRQLKLIDCSCPVVLQLQKSIREAYARLHSEVMASLDFSQPVEIFSQTTKSPTEYEEICKLLRSRGARLTVHNTICAQVASRHEKLSAFAAAHDVILFVSGKSSSNGKVLSDLCRGANPRTYLVGSAAELDPSWFREGESVGVCGATSTPKWLLEQVAEAVSALK